MSAVALLVVFAATASAHSTSPALVLSEGANPDAQHVTGTTAWIRPRTAGSFTARVDGVQVGPGEVARRIEFPTFGGEWQPDQVTQVVAPPYQVSYVWNALSAAPTSPPAAVVWGELTPIASLPFTVSFDESPPTGPTVVAPSIATRDSSAPVRGTPGVDTESGIAGWRLRRRTSPISADQCTSWSAWSELGGANPAGTLSDSLPTEGCYQYGMVATDRVGNVATVDQNGWLRVDRTVPVGSIDPIDPAAVHGGASVQLGGIARDTTTSIRSVSVVLADRYSICTNAPVDPAGHWSCSWDIGYSEQRGPATLSVTFVDQAGNRTWQQADVVVKAPPSPFGPRDDQIDRIPPIVGLARIPLVTWKTQIRVKATTIDDRPGYVDVVIEQQSAEASSTRFSEWTAAPMESEEVILEDRGDTTCYRARAVDSSGNEATSAPRCTTLPLDDTDLNWRGAWDEVDSTPSWNGTLHRTQTRGAQLTYLVADPTPQLMVTTCPSCGSVAVFHGQRRIATYRLTSPKSVFRRLIQLPKLTNPASRPLRIVSLTSNRPVLIDALVAGR